MRRAHTVPIQLAIPLGRRDIIHAFMPSDFWSNLAYPLPHLTFGVLIWRGYRCPEHDVIAKTPKNDMVSVPTLKPRNPEGIVADLKKKGPVLGEIVRCLEDTCKPFHIGV